MTKQRKLIYDIIVGSEKHLTAEEIYCYAKAECSSMAVGTVYRNLGLMVIAGEIGKVERAGEPTRYDRSAEPHCHKKCVMCGEIKDVNFEGLEELINKHIEGLNSYELKVDYLCSKCKTK